MASKTAYSRQISEISGDVFLDKGTLKKIFKAYAEHVASRSEVNINLGNQMKNLAKGVFTAYSYTLKEAADLVSVIRPAEVDSKGAKIKSNKRRTYLAEMADDLSVYARSSAVRQNNPLRNIDMDNPPAELDKDKVIEYADYIFAQAARHPQHEFRIGGLLSLVNRNGGHDKELLLNVVDSYATSLTGRDVEQMHYNQYLHEKMTKMLQRIVVKYDYSPEELYSLKCHIERGADGHEEFTEMGRVVEGAYMETFNWRYNPGKKISVAPIVHDKALREL